MTSKTLFAATCAAALLLLNSLAFAGDEASVRAFISKYDQTFSKRDVATMQSLLASDYSVVVEGERKSRAAIVAEFERLAAKGEAVQTTSTVDRVMLSGDLAVATGVITWKTKDETGQEHYTLVLREAGNDWKVVVEHVSEVAAKD